MKPLEELKEEILKDPEVKKEYDHLQDEFDLASILIEARTKAGPTQAEPARRMDMRSSKKS